MPAHIITFFVLSSVVFSDENNESKVAAGLNLRIKKYLIPFAIIILLTCSFFFTTKTGLSRKSIENAIAMEESGFLINAYQSYRDAISDMPADNEGYARAAISLKRLYKIEPDPKKKEIIKNALIICLKIMEKKKDKDSQLYFASGVCHETLGETKTAEGYLLKAISYYPSSANYINEIVRFYIINNELQNAKTWTHAIDPYLDKYMTSKNPIGFYVYRVRDLESEAEYRLGDMSFQTLRRGKICPSNPF